MAIQFILGAGGTGKTIYIYDKMIKDSQVEGHAPILFVLPEQSNMAAEQDMVTKHPRGGTMDISILSFTRLAFKVLDELNVHTADVLDDYGKSMLLMKVLKEHAHELTYYKNMLGKLGFVDEIKSALSEFYQYQVSEEVLDQAIAALNPDKSLYHKLTDLKIILTGFNEAMADSYMVAEQLLSVLKEVLHESKALQGVEIYFDGFTGFTPIQYEVIGELMKVCKNLYFSFTMDGDIFGDNGYSEQGLFALSKQSVDRLCQLASDNGVPVLPHVSLEINHRLQGLDCLQHLERQIFRFPANPYTKDCEALCIVSNKDCKQEALYIAKVIQDCVMEEGYQYKDFAIITGDLRQQSDVWRTTFEMLKIPYFLDCTEELAHNPLAEFVTMLLEVFTQDFSYDSVFSLLKSGFFDIDMNRICDLENYALKYGVRGYSWWSKPFRGGVKGLKEINETRQQFINRIGQLAECFLKTTSKTKEYLMALYSFMSTNEVANRLYDRSRYLETSGRLREAKAYIQAYDKFIAVLDKTMDILGEEEIERDILIDILRTGISQVKLGVIPSTLDQVVVGDMERTRLHEVKVVFFAGSNEGIFPKYTSGKGVLADKDRRQLKDMQIMLAPDSKDDVFIKQFYLYLQMAQASKRLVISYRQTDEKGTELRPAYFVNRVQSLFPSIRKIDSEKMLQSALPVSDDELLAELAKQLSEEELTDASVYSIMKDECEDAVAKLLHGFFYNNEAGVLDRAIAKKLYGEQMIHSVSRLETYTGCAYKFFLQYGLKISKREEYTVESNNIGTILHAVMEVFFQKVKNGEISLTEASNDMLDHVAEQLTREAAEQENETIFTSSARNRHQLDVMVRIAKRSIHNLSWHLKQGEMKPAYFEERFTPESKLNYINMALSDGIRMELNGVVDRVDIKEDEDTIYVKVIDYKSGAKDLDYVKIYEGKQLQLTVYMSVMLELLARKYPDKRIVPTGMYYYRLHDPIVDGSEDEKIEEERQKQNRLTGLVNADDKCLELMDKRTGKVTPVNYKADGSLGARNASLVSTDELLQLSDFVREKMVEIGETMISGDIAMNPEKGEHNSPCNFCDYKSICRFEPGVGGNAYRISSGLEKEEAKALIFSRKSDVESKEGGEDA
ncbi:MAG: hypothetical protein E7264_04800 [Lachnospiraceae bacterium]|nr:hypothetical protein [Lachnospiraceae bacterium]